MEFNFSSPLHNGLNGCKDGKKYVRLNTYSSGKIVGVVLCSPTRYKIYLSESLSEEFLDLSDKFGYGEDHCEFVGGKQNSKKQTKPRFHFNNDEGR